MADMTLEKGGPQRETMGYKRRLSECELITTRSKLTTELSESEGGNRKKLKTCSEDRDPVVQLPLSLSTPFCTTGGKFFM